MKESILMIDPVKQVWAKGKDVKEAAKLLRKQRGNPKTAEMYAVSADYWIDEMGNGHGSKKARKL